jgi:hypothetical protein
MGPEYRLMLGVHHQIVRLHVQELVVEMRDLYHQSSHAQDVRGCVQCLGMWSFAAWLGGGGVSYYGMEAASVPVGVEGQMLQAHCECQWLFHCQLREWCVCVFGDQRVCMDKGFQLHSEGSLFPFPNFYFAMPPYVGIGVVDNHSER